MAEELGQRGRLVRQVDAPGGRGAGEQLLHVHAQLIRHPVYRVHRRLFAAPLPLADLGLLGAHQAGELVLTQAHGFARPAQGVLVKGDGGAAL